MRRLFCWQTLASYNITNDAQSASLQSHETPLFASGSSLSTWLFLEPLIGLNMRCHCSNSKTTRKPLERFFTISSVAQFILFHLQSKQPFQTGRSNTKVITNAQAINTRGQIYHNKLPHHPELVEECAELSSHTRTLRP